VPDCYREAIENLSLRLLVPSKFEEDLLLALFKMLLKGVAVPLQLRWCFGLKGCVQNRFHQLFEGDAGSFGG
jgi:hypothetical protein